MRFTCWSKSHDLSAVTSDPGIASSGARKRKTMPLMSPDDYGACYGPSEIAGSARPSIGYCGSCLSLVPVGRYSTSAVALVGLPDD